MLNHKILRTKKSDRKALYSKVKEMYKELKKGKKEVQPSKMWEVLDSDSIEQIDDYGYENFKRTLIRHYFANTPLWFMNRQTKFLILNTNPLKTLEYFMKSIMLPTHEPFTWIDAASYNFLTYMGWEYALKMDDEGLLETFEEPLVGNPPPIYLRNKLISQDISNSYLEFKSVFDTIKTKEVKVIFELGAGSGRDAYVFTKLLPKLEKYIIIDLPPALATSEQYLSDVFPDKKIFKYREFKNFKEIKKEFEKSNFLFFLPHQIELLPDNILDLTINISSLHEMKLRQIKYYFKQIERMTKKGKYFYFKQWKIGWVSYEDECIKTEDYPVEPNWKTIYLREPKIQTKYFERLLKLK